MPPQSSPRRLASPEPSDPRFPSPNGCPRYKRASRSRAFLPLSPTAFDRQWGQDLLKPGLRTSDLLLRESSESRLQRLCENSADCFHHKKSTSTFSIWSVFPSGEGS